MERESLALLLSQGLSVEKIAARFGKHPSTVSYWMDNYGLEAVNREKHVARGGIARERLEALVAADKTVQGIAAELGLGRATVRHWLRRHGLRTSAARRTEEGIAARDAGRLAILRSCQRHGETDSQLKDAATTDASSVVRSK